MTLKRSILPAMLFTAAVVLFACGPTALAQQHGGNSASGAETTSAAREVGHAASPTAEHTMQAGEHGAAHEEIDERLVPIPPSKDTIVSAVWVLIIFILMLVILYPLAWKKVLAGLKSREERIRNDIAGAERRRREAEATLKQYNDQLAGAETRIRDMLAKAQA